MELNFLPFDDTRFSATSESWKRDTNEGLAFPSETDRLLEWTNTHREHSDIDAAGFGVFLKGKNIAHGICEVIIQRRSVRSKWIKLLKLHLKPSIDAELQAGNSDTAMAVFVAAIGGTLELQLAHKATTLKVYGRTNEQLTFLKALVGHIDKKFRNSSIKATIDGRFLCLVFT